MIKQLIAQIELIDFYLAKIEVYLRRKHNQEEPGDIVDTDGIDGSQDKKNKAMYSIAEEDEDITQETEKT
jgi:hypothetical protein